MTHLLQKLAFCAYTMIWQIFSFRRWSLVQLMRKAVNTKNMISCCLSYLLVSLLHTCLQLVGHWISFVWWNSQLTYTRCIFLWAGPNSWLPTMTTVHLYMLLPAMIISCSQFALSILLASGSARLALTFQQIVWSVDVWHLKNLYGSIFKFLLAVCLLGLGVNCVFF